MDSHQAHDDRKFFVDYRGEADGMASGAEFAGAPLHGTGSRSAHTSSRGSAANGAVAINTAATSTSGRNVPGQLTAQAPELAQQVRMQMLLTDKPELAAKLGTVQLRKTALLQQVQQTQVLRPAPAAASGASSSKELPDGKAVSPGCSTRLIDTMSKRLKKLFKKSGTSAVMPSPDQLVMLADAHPQLYQAIEQLLTAGESLQQEFMQELQGAEEQLSAARSESARLREQTAEGVSTAQQAADAKVLSLEKTVQRLRVNLKEGNDERKSLKAEMEEVQKQLASALKGIKTKDVVISKKDKELKDAASAVKTLESELDTCKEQNTKVNKDLTKATKRGDRLDKRVNELRVANEELTDANAELQRLNKAPPGGNVNLETDLKTARYEASTLRTDLKTARDEASTLRTDLKTARDEASTLRTDLKTANDACSAKTKELETESERVTEVTNQLTAARAANQRLSDANQVLRRTQEVHRQRAAAATVQVSQLSHQVHERNAQVAALETAVQDATVKNTHLEWSLNAMKGQLETVQRDAQAVADRCDRLEAALEAADKPRSALTPTNATVVALQFEVFDLKLQLGAAKKEASEAAKLKAQQAADAAEICRLRLEVAALKAQLAAKEQQEAASAVESDQGQSLLAKWLPRLG